MTEKEDMLQIGGETDWLYIKYKHERIDRFAARLQMTIFDWQAASLNATVELLQNLKSS